MIGLLLCTIVDWSWVIHTTLPSIILLGEIPYPTEDTN